jgi:hypothetical protein
MAATVSKVAASFPFLRFLGFVSVSGLASVSVSGLENQSIAEAAAILGSMF